MSRIPLTHRLKYLAVFTIPVTVAVSFTREGWLTFLPLIYAFAIIPLLELIFKPKPENESDEMKAALLNDWWYDALLVAVVPVQYAFGVWFIALSVEADWGAASTWGHLTGYGLMCGVLGINVAHELGHRPQKFYQHLAKSLLLTSLYTHFFIEHNRGHHKNVSTPGDPSSARLNESLPVFWFRSVTQTWLNAWKLEFKRLDRAKKSRWSLGNQMIQLTILQVSFLALIGFLTSGDVMLLYVLAAVMGFLLLETVNYIEHYGLERDMVSEFRYEDAGPEHSWNSDHLVGRSLLFELSRHSDHHARPAIKYPLLDHRDHSPQMPTGYPGMMLMALIPPLWFGVMNKRVVSFRLQKALAESPMHASD